MRVVELSISNYKSLRDVTFTPGPLSALVGPNDSGKSNFADALDFLSGVYRDGLSATIAHKEGFENIAFRRTSRSKEPTSFSIVLEFVPDEVAVAGDDMPFADPDAFERVLMKHHFSVGPRGKGITAGYEVVSDTFRATGISSDGAATELFSMDRSEVLGVESLPPSKRNPELARAFRTTELIVPKLRQVFPGFVFVAEVSQFRVFQPSPLSLRNASAPSPFPQVDRYGAGLPNAIARIQEEFPEEWEEILSEMRLINPGLKKIEVAPTTYRKLLQLLFWEKGVREPWTAQEVSDGTLQALAIFTAIYDPDAPLLVLEEPENSVHPWVIRRIVEACRKAVEFKQIVLTTHSPIVVDSLVPEEVWLMSRNEAGSSLLPLTMIDPDLRAGWSDGRFSISEFLDVGAVESYVPAGARPSFYADEKPGEAD